MSDCIFCKIVSGQIPASKVYEDESTLVFKDINPAAPVHLVAIPKEHFQTVQDIPAQKMDVMKEFFEAVAKTVAGQRLAKNGYRLVINSGEHAGQLVPHLHAHILAGRELGWPPG
ncbi:MAG TPA: histidine triad nucleotide-binding protein [Chitinivibrionales bacterium]|nr:histidine triad nucleotide-binding protein [Chitinivibrionales bacterium]